MNWSDLPNDPLDDLLQKAQWPETQPEQLERLNRRWNRTVRRRKVVRAVSAVAVILVPAICAVGFVAIRSHRQPAVQHVLAEKEQSPMHPSREPDSTKTKFVFDGSKSSKPTEQHVREPDAYELALVQVHRRQIASTKTVVKHSPTQPPEVDTIAAAVQQLIDDPKLSASTVAQELAAKSSNAERNVRRWLQSLARGQTDDPKLIAIKRQAALRLLGSLATADSAAVLLAALRDSDCPPEVVKAVARLCTVEQLALRARFEPIAKRQSLWLAALLERGSPQAVGEFLNLVTLPATSAAALASVNSLSGPPIDELFCALQNPRVQLRAAAAQVLGALNDPAVSKRLIESAFNPSTRREALIGLMNSSDTVAKQFLAYAQNDLSLAASMRAISKSRTPVRDTRG